MRDLLNDIRAPYSYAQVDGWTPIFVVGSLEPVAYFNRETGEQREPAQMSGPTVVQFR